MPKGSDWVNFIYVNLGFILQIFIMYFFTTIKEIKNNWPKYRCNPIYMPLSDDIKKDFTYCVQNMQINFIGYLLQPLTYIANNLSTMGTQFSETLNFARNMMSNIRTFISTIMESIYSVFLNLIIEFQKIIIGMKDLIGKILGIMITLMYVMSGSISTIKSAWNGPTGQMVRGLGMCFHPETNIKLKNGNVVFMKNLNLGDILENGSRINGVLKLGNVDNENVIYKIPGKGVNKEDIYVTGSHMIEKSKNKFVRVKDCPYAIEQDEIKCDWFTCLLTDNHIIQIGEQSFWDWDDDIFKYGYRI